MAEYKIVNATQLDNDLKNVCDLIRYHADGYIVGEISFPDGMEEALQMMHQSIADTNYAEGKTDGYNEGEAEAEKVLISVLDKSVTEITCDIRMLPGYVFYKCDKLEKVRLPIGRWLSTYTFRDNLGLRVIDMGDSTRTDLYVTSNSSDLYFSTNAFNGATALEVVVLRPNIVATLQGTGAFTSACPIRQGTGKILVPAALVDEYKVATNWSTFADQIDAIENYTNDGTLTGEFDWDSILS